MTKEKNSNAATPIDIDALVEKRMNVNKEELRQEILEEQLDELLQSKALQEATLTEALEQLKHAGKELWKLVSAKPILEVARVISGADRLEKRIKSQRKPRRSSLTTAEFEDLKTKILALLQPSKEGHTAGQISKALSLEPSVLKSVLLKLRASNDIATQGEKRSTRYSAA